MVEGRDFNIFRQIQRFQPHLNSVNFLQPCSRRARPRIELIDEYTRELVSAHQLKALLKVRLRFSGKCANEIGGNVNIWDAEICA